MMQNPMMNPMMMQNPMTAEAAQPQMNPYGQMMMMNPAAFVGGVNPMMNPMMMQNPMMQNPMMNPMMMQNPMMHPMMMQNPQYLNPAQMISPYGNTPYGGFDQSKSAVPSALTEQVPGVGFRSGQTGKVSPYPINGSPATLVGSPYSKYNYGGYDAFGFPMAHPGVASSTPPPPVATAEAAAKF